MKSRWDDSEEEEDGNQQDPYLDQMCRTRMAHQNGLEQQQDQHGQQHHRRPGQHQQEQEQEEQQEHEEVGVRYNTANSSSNGQAGHGLYKQTPGLNNFNNGTGATDHREETPAVDEQEEDEDAWW